MIKGDQCQHNCCKVLFDKAHELNAHHSLLPWVDWEQQRIHSMAWEQRLQQSMARERQLRTCDAKKNLVATPLRSTSSSNLWYSCRIFHSRVGKTLLRSSKDDGAADE